MTEFVPAGVASYVDYQEILETTGLDGDKGREYLTGKTVVDYGAGVSGFLGSLGIADVANLYELDPLYINEGIFQDAVDRNKEGLEGILAQIESTDPGVQQEMIKYRKYSDRIMNASFEPPQGIQRVTDIDDIKDSIDVVFITYLLSILHNPMEFLAEMRQSLSEQGEVYITEPIGNYNFFSHLISSAQNINGVSIYQNEQTGNATVKIKRSALKPLMKTLNRKNNP